MIKFSAGQTIYSISLLCLLFFCSSLTETHAQENKNGTDNNETIPNIPPSNAEPLADAGMDATYAEGEEFFIDGSASNDADGDELSYFWKQLTPLSPTLDIKSASANFYSKAPEVDDNTVFELELTVEDGRGGKNSDVVKITIQTTEDSETSFLSRPKSDVTATKGKDDTSLPSTSSALVGSALPKNGKNDTLLPSTSTLLPGSSLAGDKNDTLLPSTSTLLPGSSLAGDKNDTLLPSNPGTSDTLLPSLDEIIELEAPRTSSNSTSGILNVVAVGDWGCGEAADATVKNIDAISPEITLSLGDFSYQTSADCWLNLVRPIEKTLKLVKGNHDNEPMGLWKQYRLGLEDMIGGSSKTKHLIPTSDDFYYSFTQNGVHFLIMDSEISLGSDSPQYKYVKSDLEEASSNPEIKWIVVSLHRTLYWGEAVSGSNIDYNEKIASIIQQTYHPLFDLYGVDLVLAGHEHNYQRTYPLKYNAAGSQPIPTTSEKEKYENPGNPIFLTIGTGGYNGLVSPSLEAVIVDKLPKYVVSTNGEENTKGVLDLIFTDDNTLVEATFRSNNGETLDHFTISKTEDSPSSMFSAH